MSNNSPDNVQVCPRSTARSQTQNPKHNVLLAVETQEPQDEQKLRKETRKTSGGGRESISSVTLGPVSWEVPWEVIFGRSAGSGSCHSGAGDTSRSLPALFSLWHLWPPLRWVPTFCAHLCVMPREVLCQLPQCLRLCPQSQLLFPAAVHPTGMGFPAVLCPGPSLKAVSSE